MASSTPSPAGAGTQALDRAAALITTVVQADEPLTFNQIAIECSLPKSTASRLLTALERTELLERNPAGNYVAGPLFWLYATRHDPWEELVRLAHPTLETLGAETGEAVHLAVARNGRVVYVDQVDSTYLLGTRDWNDVDIPEHCSALGKVLMAAEVLTPPTAAEIEDTLERALPGARPLGGPGLTRELRRVRRNGYASAIDELEPGLAAVAVPVRGAEGQVFGALGISGPTSRFAGHIEELGRLIAARADTLSATLHRRTQREGVA